ncbi:MAG: hypothetical protein P4M02_10975 [Clostridia bacterium]|nr:hypothetical protein [Clostridia bacterium]
MGKGIFKASFVGGFRRNDVLSYIEEMDKRSSEYENKLQAENQQLQKDVASANAARAGLEKQVAEFTSNLERAMTERADAESGRRALQAEIDNLSKAVAQKNTELDSLHHDQLVDRQKIGGLEDELAVLRGEAESRRQQYEELNERLAQTARTQEQIARVMIEARVSADKMVSEAKLEAQRSEKESHERLHALAQGLSPLYDGADLIRERLRDFFDSSDELLKGLLCQTKQLESEFESSGLDAENGAESDEPARVLGFQLHGAGDEALLECASSAQGTDLPDDDPVACQAAAAGGDEEDDLEPVEENID